MGNLGSYPSGPTACAVCAANSSTDGCAAAYPTSGSCEPLIGADPSGVALVVFLVPTLLCLAVCAIWGAVRELSRPGALWQRRNRLRSRRQSSFEAFQTDIGSKSPNEKQLLLEEGAGAGAVEPDVRVAGHRDHPLGTLALCSMIFMSLFVSAATMSTLVGYYSKCQVLGIDALCFYGRVWQLCTQTLSERHFKLVPDATAYLKIYTASSHELGAMRPNDDPSENSYANNAKWFFSFWIISLIWFVTLVACKDSLFIWTKVPCNADHPSATFVTVMMETEVEDIISLDSFVLRAWSRALKVCEHYFGKFRRAGLKETVPIVRGGRVNEVPFFVFQCARYTLGEDGTWEKGTVQVGSAESVRDCGGVSDFVRAERLALIGPNSIPFHVDSWATIISAEVFSFFYLYQVLCYIVWLVFWWNIAWPTNDRLTHLPTRAAPGFVAFLLFSVVLLSLLLSVYVQRSNQQSISQLTKFSVKVRVLTPVSQEVKLIDSDDLVPGDIVVVDGNGATIPADMVLLQGSCIMNERVFLPSRSGLTGESMPVQKQVVLCRTRDIEIEIERSATPMALAPSLNDVESNQVALPSEALKMPAIEAPSKHRLFAGTTVLQAGSGEFSTSTAIENAVLAAVVATGMSTDKGELIATILFPPKMRFNYDRELPIAYALLMCYAIVVVPLVIWFQSRTGATNEWYSIWVYCVFTFSQILSPLLPIALVVGQTTAARRLLEVNVFVLNPKRIAIAGKVRVMCFDKTGTLTKEGLDFLGVQPVNQKTSATPTLAAIERNAAQLDFLHASALACCHSITRLQASSVKDGTSSPRLVGNSVEVVGFEATGWELVEETLAGSPQIAKLDRNVSAAKSRSSVRAVVAEPQASVLKGGVPRSYVLEKRFGFSHARMTMSVLARSNDGDLHAFCKGAPEKIATLCECCECCFFPSRNVVDKTIRQKLFGVQPIRSKKSSLPPNYLEAARAHALDGCYVLGLCHANLGKLDVVKASALKRDEVENASTGQLECLGFLLFRNELKPDTAAAIDELRRGDVRTIIITGDNAECGCYIARKSDMIDEGQTMLLGELDEFHSGNVSWREMRAAKGDEDAKADSLLSFTSTIELLKYLDENSSSARAGKLDLAVTGKAFSVLDNDGAMQRMLLGVRIFARMSPDQKVRAVEMHKSKGLIVGMCGDGGNDCGALRTAQVGIALSEAEASVVSPFTSKTKSVQSVVDLLREGRGALVTSFAGYKHVHLLTMYLVLYGLLFSFLKLLSFFYGAIMSTLMYIFIDVIAVVVLSLGIARSYPRTSLGTLRPTSRLFSATTISSLLGTYLIATAFIIGGIVMMENEPGYVRWPAEYTDGSQWWVLADNWESTVIFSMVFSQYAFASVSFSFGGHFRRPVYNNVALCASWAVLFTLYSVLLLTEPSPLSIAFHMASEDFNRVNTTSPAWIEYQSAKAVETGSPPSDFASPAMPLGLRWKLWGLSVASAISMALWEGVVVEGRVADVVRKRFPSERLRIDV